MTAATQTLADWLLACIAEDEVAAERGGRHNAAGTFANDNYGCLLVDPARVLAECEAKRRIVADCADILAVEGWEYDDAPTLAEETLRYLAAPYADREGYRPEWRP